MGRVERGFLAGMTSAGVDVLAIVCHVFGTEGTGDGNGKRESEDGKNKKL
jgi:hypothetical protein